MSQIKIAHTGDIAHSYKDGFSAVSFLEGAYDQARFEKCSLQPGRSVSPEVYGITQNNQLFIFLTGKGYITTPREAFNITEVAVFVPEFDRERFTVTCSADSKEALEFIHVVTELNDYDKGCLVEARIKLPRFRLLSQGWEYVENFKQDDTRSIMLIEHRNLGRLSMGAVLGKGPTVVGQHIHNELVQWYIPLPGSKLTYIAGGDQYPMKGGDVSFTPTGFHHGAQAEAGDPYDYIWFELCCDGYPGEIK